MFSNKHTLGLTCLCFKWLFLDNEMRCHYYMFNLCSFVNHNYIVVKDFRTFKHSHYN